MGLLEAAAKEATHGTIDLAGHKANFLMANEYQDFIEFLQNKLGFEQVEELQKEFGGSFCKQQEDGKVD
jgi:hypothetical protein